MHPKVTNKIDRADSWGIGRAHFKLSLYFLVVGGGDTAHGSLPWWVSSPTSDNLKCTRHWGVPKNGQ
jgi:hypothetical protein